MLVLEWRALVDPELPVFGAPAEERTLILVVFWADDLLG